MKDISEYVSSLKEGDQPMTNPPAIKTEQIPLKYYDNSKVDKEGKHYNPEIKVGDWYLKNGTVVISYLDILRETSKAILLEVITNPADGDSKEVWFPYSVLNNMCYEDKTVGVWDNFLEDNHPEVYAAYTEQEVDNGKTNE